MSVNNYVRLLEQLLHERREEAGYNSKDIKMQLIYDRGYLLGLVAMLADYDNYNAHHIVSRLNDYKKSK